MLLLTDTTLGPAIGGVRMLPDRTQGEAIRMHCVYPKPLPIKASLAGLNLGGGSAIIIGNNRTEKTEILMCRFGRFINGLNGNFIASIDVGTSQKDLEHIRTETDFVAGLPVSMNGAGETTVFAAKGVYFGIKGGHQRTLRGR